MRSSPLLRATSFRLTLLQTLLFLATFAAAGMIALAVVRRAESQAVDAEIGDEVADLRAVFGHGGLPLLKATIEARQRDPSIWEFRVEDGQRIRLAGDLPRLAYPTGWSTRRLVEGDEPAGQSEVVRAFSAGLGSDLRLTVGEDLGQRERSDNGLLGAIASIAAVAAALGLVAGALAAQRALRRIDTLSMAIERFGAGELDARVEASSRAPSDLDQLAAALNRMMDRTTGLMEGMRRISADIAHDLRRPLAHHNQQITRVLQGPASIPAYHAALQTAKGEVEEVLQTFQALLHIAELEAGAPGLDREPVDLAEVAERVVLAFAPSAEKGGRFLDYRNAKAGTPGEAGLPVTTILGEPRLMTQMVANLVENALTHTPPGARVVVEVDAARNRLTVSDDGPGVPPDARSDIFKRFVRLDASRSTPGTGLGLALGSAIAAAFGGRLTAEDADPGLRIIADFARADPPGRS